MGAVNAAQQVEARWSNPRDGSGLNSTPVGTYASPGSRSFTPPSAPPPPPPLPPPGLPLDLLSPIPRNGPEKTTIDLMLS